MSKWDWAPLEHLADAEKSSISKPYGSAFRASDYRDSGVPVVRGVNLADGVFHDDDFVFLDEALVKKVPGAVMHAGDLVVTHRGSVGQITVIPENSKYLEYVASTSQVKVRLDPNRAIPAFYYYWFTSPVGNRSITEHASTVGVPGISQPVSTIKQIKVPVPSVDMQASIVEVLGALDDKIAANERVADSANRLVDSHFQKLVGGLATSGLAFEDVAVVGGGATPKTANEEYWDGGVAWATPTDVTAARAPYLLGTARTISEAGLNACSSPLYPIGTILMTSRATIGAFAVAALPTAVNQGFIAVNAKGEVGQWWLFHEMKSRVSEFVTHANGATFLELSRGKFKRLDVRWPDEETLREFNVLADGLHRRALAAVRENNALAKTRDQILPLLMSGEVTAKDAETAVSSAV